jgi:hypothetical protein
MSTSKLQRYVSQKLSTHFSKFTIRENIKPSWLITPTGERLELDFFIEEIETAIEVQGKQHYVYVPHFHETLGDFHNQITRDDFKKEVCKTRNIKLYEIYNQEDADLFFIELSKMTDITDLRIYNNLQVYFNLIEEYINLRASRRKIRDFDQRNEFDKNYNWTEYQCTMKKIMAIITI